MFYAAASCYHKEDDVSAEAVKHMEATSLLNLHQSLCGKFKSLLQNMGLFNSVNTKVSISPPSVKPDNKEIVSDSNIWTKHLPEDRYVPDSMPSWR